jgi:hypothetical protein
MTALKHKHAAQRRHVVEAKSCGAVAAPFQLIQLVFGAHTEIK